MSTAGVISPTMASDSQPVHAAGPPHRATPGVDLRRACDTTSPAGLSPSQEVRPTPQHQYRELRSRSWLAACPSCARRAAPPHDQGWLFEAMDAVRHDAHGKWAHHVTSGCTCSGGSNCRADRRPRQRKHCQNATRLGVATLSTKQQRTPPECERSPTIGDQLIYATRCTLTHVHACAYIRVYIYIYILYRFEIRSVTE